ncbi:MAG: cobalamin-dependent protein, partial [Candidatus Sericytochromatia bacterium]
MPTSSSPVVVGLVNLTEPMEHMLYVPYSLGLLQAYAQAHAADPERYRFLLPVFRREPIAQVLPMLDDADFVGFSVYVWNIRYTLALAAALKARKPQVRIIFGGPQVPDRPEAFLRAHPFIDVCSHGEGEQTFLKLLEGFPDWDLSQIQGVSWIEGDGGFKTTGKAPRITDVDSIPSPY